MGSSLSCDAAARSSSVSPLARALSILILNSEPSPHAVAHTDSLDKCSVPLSFVYVTLCPPELPAPLPTKHAPSSIFDMWNRRPGPTHPSIHHANSHPHKATTTISWHGSPRTGTTSHCLHRLTQGPHLWQQRSYYYCVSHVLVTRLSDPSPLLCFRDTKSTVVVCRLEQTTKNILDVHN